MCPILNLEQSVVSTRGYYGWSVTQSNPVQGLFITWAINGGEWVTHHKYAQRQVNADADELCHERMKRLQFMKIMGTKLTVKYLE